MMKLNRIVLYLFTIAIIISQCGFITVINGAEDAKAPGSEDTTAKGAADDAADKDDKDDDKEDELHKEANDDTEDHDPEQDHEAIAGSKHEADEFKELSPEQSKERLGKLIEKMDLNGDKSVDSNELTAWIKQSLKKLDVESAKDKINEQDVDKDGKVSFLEFVERLYGYKPKELEEMEKNNDNDSKEFKKMIGDDKEKFEMADANKDGGLDLDEYAAFSHPQNYPHMAPYEYKKTLQDLDANKDGVIDEKEYIGNHTKDQAQLLKEKDGFKQKDKNGDGKLDKNEILLWTMPGFDETAKAETQYLFKKTDDNKDNKLSTDEIVGKHELWVGSHATDYGRHLEQMGKKQEL